MLTDRDAEKHINGMNARYREDLPAYVEDAPPVYVFSLYWRNFEANLGHLGTRIIMGLPALPGTIVQGKDEKIVMERGYGQALIVPSLIPEEYDMISGKLGLRVWETMPSKRRPVGQPGVMRDILGEGAGLSEWTSNRTWFGVFVATGAGATTAERKLNKADLEAREASGKFTSWELKKFRELQDRGEFWDFPTAHEIEQAKGKLTQMMQLLVVSGDALAMQGPNGLQQIQNTHREAVQYLNLSKTWCEKPKPQGLCPSCQEPCKPGIPVHFSQQGGCGAVLDEAKVIQMKLPGYEHLWKKQ